MKILIIDDDKNLNRGISSFLNSNNIETKSAFNGQAGFELLLKDSYDLVLSDLQLPILDGIGFLNKIIELKIDIPIIIMTAFASVETAVEALKIGAEDYLIKPLNLKELLFRIEKINKSILLKEENNNLKSRILNYEMPEIIGESKTIKELKELLIRISNDSNIPIYIYGKSGTGKELVARNIHYMSERRDKKFVPINCAVLSDDLMESELFGYEKGAFTGAIEKKIGIIENSEGGTIFLDEISELSSRVQSKLLRILQDMVIQPIGSNEMKKVDVRFICASNKKLEKLVEQNKFREDLYYRLNVVEVEVPSLRARINDMPNLIDHIIKKYNLSIQNFEKESLDILQKYDWPGNIRELENLIRMLNLTITNKSICPDDIPQKFKRSSTEKLNLETNYPMNYQEAFNRVVMDFERSFLEYHLKENNYNISRTSEMIGLSRVSLHKKIKEYSILLP